MMRKLFLVLALLILGAQPADASPFGLKFLHKGPQSTPVTYDNRYGTNTAQTAIDGWFQFTPSGGVAIYYVDSGVLGNDSNNCTAAATPCKTLDAVWPKFTADANRNGGHLRIAGTGGRTYNATLSSPTFSPVNGISATYPAVVESYDPADPTNAAKYGRLTGTNQPVIYIGGSSYQNGAEFQNACSCGSNIAFQGLTFDGNDQDGPGLVWQNTGHDGIIFQNDRFSDIQLTLNSGVSYDATAASYNQGGNVSKSAFMGGWASGGNMQCAYIHGTNGLHIEDNVWVHCGWRIGSARPDNGANGGASGVNHAHYIGASDAGIVLARNWYTDSSYDGINLRGSGTITSSASLDEPLIGNLGAFSGSQKEAPDGVTIQGNDMLMMGGSPITTVLLADGPHNTNTLSGSYIRNVAAFDNPYPSIFFSSSDGNSSFNIVSLTHSGTTATMTVDSPHLMLTGDLIIVDLASPSAYNVVQVPVTVINSTTLTYTMATTPATDATVLGKYMPQVPQFMLVDKVHSYNYATSWDNISWIPAQIHNTYTNIISDQLATGGGNSTSNGSTFTGYKTRDQVITAVLTGIGLTPGASYYARKAQIINAATARPDLPWAQWLIGVGFPAMNLTPTYTTPAYQTFTDTPLTTYATSLSNLTISSTTFVHGVSKTVLLGGVSALPVLTASGLPSGCSISARSITCNAVSAGTPSVTVHETTQDGSLSHDTVFTFTISFLFGAAPIRRRRRKAANDNEALALAA